MTHDILGHIEHVVELFMGLRYRMTNFLPRTTGT